MSAFVASFPKDPSDEEVPYMIDWSCYLYGDIITASSWEVMGDAPAMVIDSDTHTTTTATVLVSGGMSGRRYTVTNTVTLGSNSQDRQRSIDIPVLDL